MLGNPAACGQLLEESFVETAWGAVQAPFQRGIAEIFGQWPTDTGFSRPTQARPTVCPLYAFSSYRSQISESGCQGRQAQTKAKQ
jgi:hypothetical protein